MAGFTSELVARCTVLGSDLVIQNGTKSEGAADLHAGSSDSSPELIAWEGANKNSARTQKQIARKAAGCKLLILLEAAIGIEPMNKGFADHLAHLSPSAIEYHTVINIDLSRHGQHSVALHVIR